MKSAGFNGEVTVTFLPGLTWNVTSDAETGTLPLLRPRYLQTLGFRFCFILAQKHRLTFIRAMFNRCES